MLKTQKNELKWKEGKGEDSGYWKSKAGFTILRFNDGRKTVHDLMQYQDTIGYFKKLSTAKKVAQLIYEG